MLAVLGGLEAGLGPLPSLTSESSRTTSRRMISCPWSIASMFSSIVRCLMLRRTCVGGLKKGGGGVNFREKEGKGGGGGGGLKGQARGGP